MCNGAAQSQMDFPAVRRSRNNDECGSGDDVHDEPDRKRPRPLGGAGGSLSSDHDALPMPPPGTCVEVVELRRCFVSGGGGGGVGQSSTLRESSSPSVMTVGRCKADPSVKAPSFKLRL